MKSVRLAATIAASAAIAAACNLSAAATVPGLPRDLSAQDIARIEAFEEAHPLDIAGLGALVKEVSGQEMHVSVSASIRRGDGCAVMANAPVTRKNGVCEDAVLILDRSTRSASLPYP